MTGDDVIYRSRVRLFALAREMGATRAAWRMLGVHRSAHCRWRRLMLRYGPTWSCRAQGPTRSPHRASAPERADPVNGDDQDILARIDVHEQ